MSKRLLIITQNVDETDDLLGFFVAWIKEFAKHFDHIDIITLKAGTYALPAHVRVHTLGSNRKRSLVRLLWRYTPRDGAVFCHMSPIFALVAWPFSSVRRSRLVLWYLHRSRTLRLRLALALCDRLVTADAASLTVRSSKIVAVGHGIDVGSFAVPNRRYDISYRPLRILSVGRLAPIKDFATLIRAVKLLRDQGRSVQVHIVGRAILPEHHEHEAYLRELVRESGLEDTVEFIGFVPYTHMPEQYRWADIVVGCTPPGGLDKALLEGMAAGCVVLTSNTVMRATLGAYADRLIFRHGDADDLADKILRIVPGQELSADMVRAVREHHDLSRTVAKIFQLL